MLLICTLLWFPPLLQYSCQYNSFVPRFAVLLIVIRAESILLVSHCIRFYHCILFIYFFHLLLYGILLLFCFRLLHSLLLQQCSSCIVSSFIIVFFLPLNYFILFFLLDSLPSSLVSKITLAPASMAL